MRPENIDTALMWLRDQVVELRLEVQAMQEILIEKYLLDDQDLRTRIEILRQKRLRQLEDQARDAGLDAENLPEI
jgi:hypothetical protein